METNTYEQHLIQAGLSREQALVYGSLVASGASLASDTARRAGISRTLTYKVLAELSELGLVEKRDQPGKVATFVAAHPLKLKELIEKRQQEAKDALSALEGVLGPMTSEYNIAGGKPGIEFFEGMDGIRKVIFDTLTSKDELCSYADIEAIAKYALDLNKEYVEARNRRKIKKRMLILDTPGSRAYFGNPHEDITDIRFLKAEKQPFQTVMHIYDGKVSYIAFSDERLIGCIIHDQHIFLTHQYLFDFTWAHGSLLGEQEELV